MAKKKKVQPLTKEEKKRLDFLFSFPGTEIIGIGEGREDKKSTFYRWQQLYGDK